MKMYKISKEDAEKIREEMTKTAETKIYKKLQVVALRGEGRQNDEIASITGYNSNYVSELCKTYVVYGLEELKTDGRKGGNNRNMNVTEAAEFLQKFEDQAKKGQVVTIETMGLAYDEAIGVEHKSLSSIYYFLHSNGWRKIMPQKQHPGRASDEVIETSKKLTLN